jgi:L-ascorbate metabolism protein UlaG (beta-lactamase superfamily)
MKITKLGHCCLVIEEAGQKILTDPGTFTTSQNEMADIDILLITHEHADHYHLDSVQAILKNNPNIHVVTNSAVGALLTKEGIAYTKVGDGESAEVGGIKFEGFGKEHAPIWPPFGLVENTGYFIDGKLFYPGDAFYNPQRPVDILALPAGGPWMKVSEAIQYALDLKPRIAFPVHDAMFKEGENFNVRILEAILPKNDIQFVAMNPGDTKEF